MSSFLRVTIKDATVNQRSGVKNGREWTMRQQRGFIEHAGETRAVDIPLERDQPPHAAGTYQFDLAGQIRFGRYGLEFDDRLKLVPAKA